MYLQNALHFFQRLVRFGDSCAYRFCTVDAGTTAKANDCVAVIFVVKGKGFIYIRCGRVCHRAVIDHIRNKMLIQSILQTSNQTMTDNTGIRDNQNMVTFLLFQNLRNTVNRVDNLRLAVRQKRKGCFQNSLK